MAPACATTTGSPGYRIGDLIALRVMAGEAGDFALGSYPMVMVAVGEHGGIKVLPVTPAQPGVAAELMVPVATPAEETLLMVLARRGWAFDPREIRQDLERVLAGRPEGEWINIAQHHLTGQAPGAKAYLFRGTADPGECS